MGRERCSSRRPWREGSTSTPTRAIESIRDALQATGVKNVRLLLSGSGVFASEARATIQSEARWLSALATVLVILILLAAYRAPGPVVLSALPVATGLVAGVAAVSWIFGAVHGITLGFGATLIGEAVDYPRLRLHPGCARRAPPRHALAHRTDVAAGCAHDSLRRIGDGALELPGLAQLGCLPSSEWARRGSRRAECCPRSLSQLRLRARSMHCPSTCAGRWNSRKGSWVVAAFVVAGLAVIAWRYDRLWDDDLANLSPLSEAAGGARPRARNWERPISAISSLPR